MTRQEEIDQLKAAREEMELLRKATDLTARDLNRNFSTAVKYARDIAKEERNLQKLKATTEAHHRRLIQLQKRATPEQQKLLDIEKEKVLEQYKYIENNEKILAALKKQISFTQGLGNTIKELGQKADKYFVGQVTSLPAAILEAQRSFLKMNLALGASGDNADRLVSSLMQAKGYAANLGMSFQELADIQEEFTKGMGRMSGANGSELKALADIAKGTGLGATIGTQLANSYESIGINAALTAEMIGDIMNKSESMGVLGTSALEEINKNFARAQNFTFSKGVKGFEEMAMYAQKTKMSIEDVFNAAEKARTLEGSLEMASKLMVMGGNFAKTDPFQLSFLARNKPEEFQKKLADMTKGVARFNSATGEFEVSAVDMDRLRAVADATGISLETMKKTAIEATRQAAVKKSLFVGNQEDRDFIAKMATMGKNGRFTIAIGDKNVDVSKLTQQQVNLLRQQEKTLEQRAKDSQAFDEVWKNFVEELKSTALPLAKHLDWVTKRLTDVINIFRSEDGGLNKLAYALVAVVGGLKLVLLGGQLAAFTQSLKDSIKSFMGMFRRSGIDSSAGSSMTTTTTASGRAGGAGKGMGKMLGSAGAVAALGAAFVGMGYGIKLATEGIAQLAEAMKGMDADVASSLWKTVTALTAGFLGLGVAMAVLGSNPAGWAGAALIALVAASVAGTALSIGYMTDGIANMFTSMKQLSSMNISPLTDMFASATDFLTTDSSNMDKLKETIAMINLVSNTQSKVMTEIKDLLSKPLKMELADNGKIDVCIDLTTYIDSDVLVKNTARKFAVYLKKTQAGKN
jgi:hypothetical protein